MTCLNRFLIVICAAHDGFVLSGTETGSNRVCSKLLIAIRVCFII